MMGAAAGSTGMGPSWLAAAFAAVMIVTAVYCAGRIIAARWWRRPTGYDTDAVHVLMGTAMAGMLVPGLHFGPTAGWEIVFGAAAGWFGWQAWQARHTRQARQGRGAAGHRPGQHVQHLLASLAMLYMLVAVGRAAGGPVPTEMGGSTHVRTLALLLALGLLGYVINTADRLTALPLAAGAGPAPSAPSEPPTAAVTVPAAPADLGRPTARGSETATAPTPAMPVTPATSVTSATARTPALSPRLAACCDIAMGVTMGYLLVLMVSS